MSAGTALAIEQKENATGRQYFDAFNTWAKKNDIERSPEAYQQWDIEHNESKLEALFRERYDLEEVALKILYRQAFYSYDRMLVELSPKVKVIVQASRSTPEGRIDFRQKFTAQDLANIRAKVKREYVALNRRIKLYNLSKQELKEIFAESLDEI